MIKIAVPSYKTKEALYLLVLTGLLVIRTYMSIWLADVNGQVVKAIVNRNFSEFVRRVIIVSESDFLVDFRVDAVRGALVSCKFRNGVLQQTTRYGLQTTPH